MGEREGRIDADLFLAFAITYLLNYGDGAVDFIGKDHCLIGKQYFMP